MYIPKPKEISPGFYAVKETGLIPISKDGRIIDKLGNVFTPNVINKNGYIHLGKTHLHRVLALTFISSNLNLTVDTLIVNHKDGNKLNNNLSNLEWVDHSGNLDHAFNTGLRPDNHLVKCLNVTTNEIKHFRSISKLAEYLKTTVGSLSAYLRRKDRKCLYHGKWNLVYENEKFTKTPLLESEFPTVGTSRYILGYLNDKIYIFNSIRSVIKFTGKSRGAVEWALKKGLSLDGLTLKYLNKNIDYPNRDKWIKVYNKIPKPMVKVKTKPKKIKVTNLITKKIEIKNSIKDVADELGLMSSTLQRYIWRTGGVRGNYHYEYLK